MSKLLTLALVCLIGIGAITGCLDEAGDSAIVAATVVDAKAAAKAAREETRKECRAILAQKGAHSPDCRWALQTTN